MYESFTPELKVKKRKHIIAHLAGTKRRSSLFYPCLESTRYPLSCKFSQRLPRSARLWPNFFVQFSEVVSKWP